MSNKLQTRRTSLPKPAVCLKHKKMWMQGGILIPIVNPSVVYLQLNFVPGGSGPGYSSEFILLDTFQAPYRWFNLQPSTDFGASVTIQFMPINQSWNATLGCNLRSNPPHGPYIRRTKINIAANPPPHPAFRLSFTVEDTVYDHGYLDVPLF
jgi:hypothetical protein